MGVPRSLFCKNVDEFVKKSEGIILNIQADAPF